MFEKLSINVSLKGIFQYFKFLYFIFILIFWQILPVHSLVFSILLNRPLYLSFVKKWLVKVLLKWCIKMLKMWCIKVFKMWCIKVLKRWCIKVLKMWCIKVLKRWRVQKFKKKWNRKIEKCIICWECITCNMYNMLRIYYM